MAFVLAVLVTVVVLAVVPKSHPCDRTGSYRNARLNVVAVNAVNAVNAVTVLSWYSWPPYLRGARWLWPY